MPNINISVTSSALKEKVKRSLSIIGKRAVDVNGNNIFEQITLSTNEEPILDDFFAAAIAAIAADLGKIATLASANSGYTLTLDNPRIHPTRLTVALQAAVDNYMVAYALFSWFVVTAPKIAEKYKVEADNHRAFILTIALEKEPPKTNEADFISSVSTSVSTTTDSTIQVPAADADE